VLPPTGAPGVVVLVLLPKLGLATAPGVAVRPGVVPSPGVMPRPGAGGKVLVGLAVALPMGGCPIGPVEGVVGGSICARRVPRAVLVPVSSGRTRNRSSMGIPWRTTRAGRDVESIVLRPANAANTIQNARYTRMVPSAPECFNQRATSP
jgi:hypothetical protein